MKRRISSFLLLGAVLLATVGCGTGRGEESNGTERQADCVVGGKAYDFVGDEVKKEWEEPLARLLSNVYLPYGENGDILGYEATVDPHAPVIPQSYACGLFDVTGDGVPELLVYPLGYGGSSGNATYFVYNFYSGQKLGEIDGGNAQSLCLYHDTEKGDTDIFGRYWLRGGWAYRGRYITEVTYDEMLMECFQSTYLSTSHDVEQEETVDEDGEMMIDEIYSNTEYYVYGKEVSIDDYYAEYDSFSVRYVRIPETELVTVRWSDVTEDADDYVTRGQKMARALLQTDQAFLAPAP